MRIIIVGCGKVGSALAEQLSAEGHELTLIDLSERRLEKLTNRLDLTAVAGSGTSYQVLLEAGVQDTDLVIAVTAHDEINLLSCLTARKASGCHAIARVRDPQYVADPTKGYSGHSRGNTVDVTLVSADGSPVPMPTDFDDFTAMADRDYSDVSDTAAYDNVRLLEDTMVSCGFRPYSAEWWHFTDTTDYPVVEE